MAVVKRLRQSRDFVERAKKREPVPKPDILKKKVHSVKSLSNPNELEIKTAERNFGEQNLARQEHLLDVHAQKAINAVYRELAKDPEAIFRGDKKIMELLEKTAERIGIDLKKDDLLADLIIMMVFDPKINKGGVFYKKAKGYIDKHPYLANPVTRSIFAFVEKFPGIISRNPALGQQLIDILASPGVSHYSELVMKQYMEHENEQVRNFALAAKDQMELLEMKRNEAAMGPFAGKRR